MDIPSELLRNPNDGTANLTIAPMGTINHEDPWKFPFYKEDTQTLSIPLVIRSIHATKDDYDTATQAVSWRPRMAQRASPPTSPLPVCI